MRADILTMEKIMKPTTTATTMVEKSNTSTTSKKMDPMFEHCQSMPGMSGCAEILAGGSSSNMSMGDHMNMSSDPMAMSMADM